MHTGTATEGNDALDMKDRSFFRKNLFLILISSLCFIILYIVDSFSSYGYFRDELYYIACSKHLAAGYVDHPPFSIFVLSINRFLFGDSIAALRLIPSLSAAASVFFTGLMVRRLGGRLFSQGLAALCLMIAPVFLMISSFYSMNSFEILLGCIIAYLLIVLLQTDNRRYLLYIGIAAGIGLLNKHTMILFLLGIVAAFAVTPSRKYFRSPFLYLGALAAALILLPNIVWQFLNGWPSLEFYRNADFYKNVPTPPLNFIVMQVLSMHPLTLPVWLGGLYFLILDKKAGQYRAAGWTFIIMFLLLMASRTSRPDRLAAAYPMLIASGSFFLERSILRSGHKWLRPVIAALLLVAGLFLIPVSLPVLPPAALTRYTSSLGLTFEIEKGKKTQIPQLLADRLGWEELAITVSKVYNGLSPEEKKHAVIATGNYGEAGALEFYAKKYNLPRVLCGHNNYYLWGMEQNCDCKLVIAIGSDKEQLQEIFGEVKEAAIHTAPYVMDYENNLPIYIARYPRKTFREIWPGSKKFV